MPNDLFLAYINPVIGAEGRYSNNPNDSGGETMWGITAARAHAAGYNDAMRDMTKEQAIEIYRLFYWRQPMFDALAERHPALAALCLDFGVNMGTTWPGRFVQRALNVLNKQATFFADLTVDGVMGAMTRAALHSYFERRGSIGMAVLMDMVRAQASVRYIQLAEVASKNEDFEYGWQANRAFGAANADVAGGLAT